MKTIAIGSRHIGANHPTYIIAEAGVAHFGSFDLAKALVDMAVEAEADAVKFQVYQTERLISKGSQDWIKRLKTKELSYSTFRELKEYCIQQKIEFLATPHEEYSSDFLDELGVPAFKVGSGEVSNTPFISHLAAKGKPLLISTGLHNDRSIQEILETCYAKDCQEIALFHCVTAYPTPVDQVNLRSIPWMSQRYGVPVGYSDHTVGYMIPLAAVAMGAHLIEKHICLDKEITGSQDCQVACNRHDLIDFVESIRTIESALGVEGKELMDAARPAMDWARKSIVAARDIEAGDTLTAKDVIIKRPGTGISPDKMDQVIGKKLRRAISKDEVLQREDLSGS